MLAEPIRPGPDGILRVPSAAGLGIVLDEAAIRRYAA
jgi:L-alanine-DL-glutamate epimerase-like enolase superfamily enzyme